MIKLSCTGDFSKTENFLKNLSKRSYVKVLERYAREGVNALAQATPTDSGKTASSWDYEITANSESATIYWTNSNVNKNTNIAIILQYGHGNGRGGFVQGVDYINPALKPIFEKIADEAWKEVTGK